MTGWRDEAAEVRPLGQVRLAEDDRAGGAAAGPTTVASRGHAAADEGERAGGGLHRVVRRDVVLDQDRDAVERPAELAGPPFAVAPGGDADGRRVRLDDGTECRIEGRDPGEVGHRQLAARELTRFHEALEPGDRGLEPGLVLVGSGRRPGEDAGAEPAGHERRATRGRCREEPPPADRVAEPRRHRRLLRTGVSAGISQDVLEVNTSTPSRASPAGAIRIAPASRIADPGGHGRASTVALPGHRARATPAPGSRPAGRSSAFRGP